MPTYYFYLFSDEERQCDANIAHLVGSSLATIYVEDERVHIKSFDRDTGLILFETQSDTSTSRLSSRSHVREWNRKRRENMPLVARESQKVKSEKRSKRFVAIDNAPPKDNPRYCTLSPRYNRRGEAGKGKSSKNEDERRVG